MKNLFLLILQELRMFLSMIYRSSCFELIWIILSIFFSSPFSMLLIFRGSFLCTKPQSFAFKLVVKIESLNKLFSWSGWKLSWLNQIC